MHFGSLTYYGNPQPARNIGMGFCGVTVHSAQGAFDNPTSLAFADGSYSITSYRYSNTDDPRQILDYLHTLGGKKFSMIGFASTNFGLFYRPLAFVDSTYLFGSGYQTKSYTIRDYMLSVASVLQKNYYVGLNLHYITSGFAEAYVSQDTTYALLDHGKGIFSDLGLMYYSSFLSLGLCYKNVISYMFWDHISNQKIKGSFNVGGGIHLKEKAIISFEYTKPYYLDNQNIYKIGGELNPLSTKKFGLSIRAGYVFGSKTGDKLFTQGMGFRYKGTTMNMALARKNLYITLIFREEPQKIER